MPITVLVVDDHRGIREFIADVLLDQGCAVETAPDGQVALERVREHPPNLILVDYQMPRCDGPQFVRAYRQLPQPHAPIVLITAAMSAQQRAAEVGADAFLAKPFALDALLGLVERFAAA